MNSTQTSKVATIVLIKGNPTELLTGSLKDKNIVLHNSNDTFENANDKAFNESKFFGTVCVSLSSDNVAFSDAETLVTKKGALSIVYTFGTRMKLKVNELTFVVVADDKTGVLCDWAVKNKVEIVTVDEFKEYVCEPNKVNVDLNKVKVDLNKVNVDLKVTCGLMCRSLNVQEKEPIIGHRTCAFGVSLDEANKLKEDNGEHIKQTYDGCNIALTIDGKNGGSVIAIPQLGSTAHITNNTTIRSVLSGPVVEKYNDGVMQFMLSEIDPKVKQDKNITIEKTADTKVEIFGWYTYAVDM